MSLSCSASSSSPYMVGSLVMSGENRLSPQVIRFEVWRKFWLVFRLSDPLRSKKEGSVVLLPQPVWA